MYILIPELLLVIFVIWEFLKLKKQKRSFNEILGNIYNICDENTKFGLDFIKKERFDITSIRSLNLFELALLALVIIAIVWLIVILLNNCIDRSKKECEKEGTNPLNEEENTENNELRDIN